MQGALEAVADFLSKYGALEEAKAIMEVLGKMGHPVGEDSPLRWRALLAIMKQELSDNNQPVNFVFFFDRLIQLAVTVPDDMCRALFSSPIFLHILVERFAVVVEGHDADLFREEREDLFHAEGIHEVCLLMLDKFPKESRHSSPLGQFMSSFTDIFTDDDPKSRWEVFYEEHRINDAAFRRDMKRVLRVVEGSTIGETVIERVFSTTDDQDSNPTEQPIKIAPRHLLEQRFNGSSDLWRDLSDINSIDLSEVTSSSSSQKNSARSDRSSEQINRVERAKQRRASAAGRRVRVSAAPTPAPAPAVNESGDDDDVSSVASDAAPPADGGVARKKRKRWSASEVEALVDGYEEFGDEPNVWVLIKAKYPKVLRERSNVDIKDKHRNLQKARQRQ